MMPRFALRGYNPEPIESPQNALMRGLEMQRAQQGNALQQAQLGYYQQEKALALQKAQEEAASRNALMQFRRNMPDPQAAAVATLGGARRPTPENASRIPQVDPRIAQATMAFKAGMIPYADFQKIAYPEQKLQAVGMDQNIVDLNNPTAPIVRAGQVKPAAKPSAVQEFEYGQQNPAFNSWQLQGKRAGATNVNVGAAEREFDKELAKLDAKQLDAYRDQADKSATAVTRAQAMKAAVNGGVYSGSFAGDRTKLANFFATLGAPGVDMSKLANSQEYQKHAKELTLSVLKDGVGASNISNADLAFVNETVPQLETSPQARANLLAFIERKAQANVDRFQQADQYARKNRGLGGFKPNAQTADPSPAGGADAVRKFNPATGRIE